MSTGATIKDSLQEDIKTAMRAQDKVRLGTLRLIASAIKQKEVDERIVLGDAEVLAILDKMVKQRRESITQFEAGGRPELAAKEQAEIVVIQGYMPQPLTEAEIEQMVAAAVAQTGATSVKDMGKVMGVLKPQMQGRADMAVVGNKIKAKLSV
ncbi:MAG: GatB/YqeY domain-containing protein [Gammaproteobacteria bacterium]|nr:GatB/YqeY domain-containing protein [Gammaproteobacteria bacterium]